MKVVLIGSGAVGTSFLYSSINQGLASEYGIMDLFKNSQEGNVLDLEDVIHSLNGTCKIYESSYQDLGNADCILIAAGRPQKEGETRLDMVKDNVKIIKNIAREIKKTSFSGITLICANPVDVLTYAYLKETNYDPAKVIGSGTVLDTARLNIEISKNINIDPHSINGAYVIGEHGDSSLVTFSNINIQGTKLSDWTNLWNDSNYEDLLEKYVSKKAYKIISLKRATYYGIGAGMAKILRAIVEDKREVIAVGAYLNGEYGQKDIVIGVPCVIGSTGIQKIVELPLNNKETNKFQSSCEVVRKINQASV